MGRSGSRNYYDLLGVMPSATMAELKRAYREKAKSFHPDLNQGEETQAQFRAIQEAYNILRDPVERTFYDRGLGLKSNWVDEAAKDSERRRANRTTGDARDQAEDAESQARPRSAPRPPREDGPRASAEPRTGAEGRASSGPAGAAGPSTGASSGGASATGAGARTAQEDGGASGADTRRGASAQSGPRASTRSASGFRSARGEGGRAGRRATPRGDRREEEEAARPAPPPPPPPRRAWYRDRPLRIFLAASTFLAATVLFVVDPPRGVFFLVLGFGIEGLYRLEDLKEWAIRPPSFRPPPRPGAGEAGPPGSDAGTRA